MKNIERLFNLINKNLFCIDSTLDYDRITDALITLSNTLMTTETDESVWGIGEGSECCLDDLIIGAYWHYTEWHAGQYSKSYAALCALGRVFSPGMGTPDDENITYQMLNDLAEGQ